MASPQCEDGYTRIANEILEWLVTIPLNGTQLRLALTIIRYTYGFNRKAHELSENFLASAVGTSKRQVRREIKDLVELGIISVIQEASFTRSRTLSFNKDYERWHISDTRRGIKPLGANQTPEDKLDPSPEDKLDPSPEDKLDPSPEDKLDPQERHSLKTNKKNIVPFQEIVDYLNQKAGTHYRATTESTKKHIRARWNDGFTLEDFQGVVDKKARQWGKDPQMAKYLRPETLFGNKFESYLNEPEAKLTINESKPKIDW